MKKNFFLNVFQTQATLTKTIHLVFYSNLKKNLVYSVVFVFPKQWILQKTCKMNSEFLFKYTIYPEIQENLPGFANIP